MWLMNRSKKNDKLLLNIYQFDFTKYSRINFKDINGVIFVHDFLRQNTGMIMVKM